MSNVEALDRIEKRAFRSAYQAGLVDIMFGSLLLVFAIISVMELLGVSRFYGYPLLIMPLVVNWAGKRFITAPRLGVVQFGEKRQKRNRTVRLIGLGMALIMAPVVIIVVKSDGLSQQFWMLVALAGAPLLLLGIYLLDLGRVWLYAGLLLFAIVASEQLAAYLSPEWSRIVSFGLPGLAISAIGVGMLVKFLNRYPSRSSGGVNG